MEQSAGVFLYLNSGKVEFNLKVLQCYRESLPAAGGDWRRTNPNHEILLQLCDSTMRVLCVLWTRREREQLQDFPWMSGQVPEQWTQMWVLWPILTLPVIAHFAASCGSTMDYFLWSCRSFSWSTMDLMKQRSWKLQKELEDYQMIVSGHCIKTYRVSSSVQCWNGSTFVTAWKREKRPNCCKFMPSRKNTPRAQFPRFPFEIIGFYSKPKSVALHAQPLIAYELASEK